MAYKLFSLRCHTLKFPSLNTSKSNLGPQYDSAYHLQTYINARKLYFWQPHPIFEFERIVIEIIIATPTR